MADYPDGYVEAHLPDYPDAPERPEKPTRFTDGGGYEWKWPDAPERTLSQAVAADPAIPQTVKLWLIRDITALEQERDDLAAEVREWLCADCDTIYPGPPQEGVHCVVCPKCGGDTMPRNVATIRDLRAALAGRDDAKR